MKNTLQQNSYTQLVEDITELYGCASRALVEAYWQIGTLENVRRKECKKGRRGLNKAISRQLSTLSYLEFSEFYWLPAYRLLCHCPMVPPLNRSAKRFKKS